jgi:hypothetical protein
LIGFIEVAMERFIRLLRILLIRKLGERAQRLVSESRKTGDHTMTLFLLGRELTAIGEDLSPHFLREILAGAGRRDPGYAEFLQHVGDVRTLATFTGNDFMSSVLQISRRQQLKEVVEMLASTPPQKRIHHSDDTESRTPEQDYVPLGVRKSLARKPNLQTIEKMVHEQDPQVIRHLLMNSRTTEEIVVKMASLRPTSHEVLEEIFVSQRWSSRLRVRKALVFNPYTLPRTAHALLPMLLMQDLMDVTLSPSLHPSVKSAAKRFILHRVSAMGPAEKEDFSRNYSARLKRIFLQVG